MPEYEVAVEHTECELTISNKILLTVHNNEAALYSNTYVFTFDTVFVFAIYFTVILVYGVGQTAREKVIATLRIKAIKSTFIFLEVENK